MTRWRCFELIPLHIYWNGDGMWWVLLLHLRLRDWEGQLLGIEYDLGRLKVEVFYLRNLVYRIKDWWES